MIPAAATCPGGTVLDWSATSDARFNHYLVLRNSTASIPAGYPPQGGASTVDGAFSTKATKTAGADTDRPAGSTWFYRALAFDAADRVIAASAVQSAAAAGIAGLGELAIKAVEGGTHFSWTPFAGDGTCFTYYKLVRSFDDPTPSYLEGAPYAWAGERKAAGEAIVEGLEPGTQWFRIQAIRVTDLGKFVVAQSEAVSYTVP